jgi:hypothetical protein
VWCAVLNAAAAALLLLLLFCFLLFCFFAAAIGDGCWVSHDDNGDDGK